MATSSAHPYYRDKTIALSGANRGIGLALARHLAASGATVWAGCRTPSQASELNEAAKSAHGALHVLPLDVTSQTSVEAFAGHLPAKLDVLFNNAGVNLDHGESPNALPIKTLEDSLATNTLGPLRMMQALWGKLAAAHGKVANISSIMGSIADNEMGGNTAYRVSKTALNMLNKNFALAHPEVVFLTLHPGWVQTDMGGAKAPVEPPASAAGLLAVVAKATAKDSGAFWRFDGHSAPW